MGKGAELLGRRFGMLEVIEKMGLSQDNYKVWRCRCDCGGEILANTRRLTGGLVTNCGCIPKSNAKRGSIAEDLTGRRFGQLTAQRRVESLNGRTRWLCRCDCGGSCVASSHDLKAGKVSSCGCKRERSGNKIMDISGLRFGRLLALAPTSRRDKKGSVYWICRCDCGNELEVSEDGLVQGNNRSCGCLRQEMLSDISNKLHRIDGTCVEWLEKRKHRCDNTSGFRGVYPQSNGKFRAAIGFKGRRFNIGTYSSFEEAVRARQETEELIHGGFVKAYYRWLDTNDSLPETERTPLIFDVGKNEKGFFILTNMEP